MIFSKFKRINNVILVSTLLSIILTGCEPHRPKTPDGLLDKTEIYSDYQPIRVSFLPLTEIKPAQQEHLTESLSVFVSLHDSDNSAIKSPAVFRFELYEHLVRSGENKGKRIYIWPDIDLTDFEKNNEYWRDYLRAYEFKLDLEATSNKTYILELTCITPFGKRLINQYELSKN